MSRYLVCRIIGEPVEMFGLRVGEDLTGTDMCAIFADVSEHDAIASRLVAGETVAYVTPIGRRARARIAAADTLAAALVASFAELDPSIKRWTRTTRAAAVRVWKALLRKGKSPSTPFYVSVDRLWAVDVQEGQG